MTEALYKKTDLSRVFGETLNEHKDQKEMLLKLWDRIKALPEVDLKLSLEAKKARGDRLASFACDYAAYVYMLMDGNAKKDEYWTLACNALEKLARDYSGSGGIESQWGQLSLLVAQKIAKGEQYIYKGGS